MDKDRVKKGLINAAPYIAGAAVQIPIMFNDGNWFSLAMFLTNAGVSYVLYKNGVVKYDRDAFVKLPICQEYLGLYGEFVNDVAKMYSDLGIDPGIESAIAYKMCLDNGIFSCDGTNKYALYEDDSDKFIAFFGGRVTTGAHCCRHSASLFSDINNKMKKGLSPKISVYVDKDVSKKIKLVPNHLVSGLVHKNKKLLFDSTSSVDSMFADGLGYFQDKTVNFRQVVENHKGVKFTLVSDGYDNRFLGTDTFDQFMRLESIKLSEEVFDDFQEAIFSCPKHIKDFRNFHEEEKPKILRLSNLNKLVSPHGKEITSEK